MISNIVAWSHAFFIIDPALGQISEHSKRANVSAAAVRRLRQSIVWPVRAAAPKVQNERDPNCSELSRVLQPRDDLAGET